MALYIDTFIKDFKLKRAEAEDIPLVLRFIRELAEYENMLDEVVADEQTLYHSIVECGYAKALIAYEKEIPVGFAVYFHNFSTFDGRAGIYIEDVYIVKEYRGKGYGKMIFTYLANEAVTKGFTRLEWSCLNWNKPSIDFYDSIGARNMCEWRRYRLSGQELSDNANYFKGRNVDGIFKSASGN